MERLRGQIVVEDWSGPFVWGDEKKRKKCKNGSSLSWPVCAPHFDDKRMQQTLCRVLASGGCPSSGFCSYRGSQEAEM